MTALRYKVNSREEAEGNHNLEAEHWMECEFCGERTADVRERKSYDSQDIYMCCAECNSPEQDEWQYDDDDWDDWAESEEEYYAERWRLKAGYRAEE